MAIQGCGAWRRTLFTSMALLAGASAFGWASGCTRSQETILMPSEEGEIGQMRLSLTAVSSNDIVYRLSNAVFSIRSRTGGAEVLVNSEDYPDQATLLVELEPDVYDVELLPGWALVVLEEGLPLSSRRSRVAKPVPLSGSGRSARAVSTLIADAGVGAPSEDGGAVSTPLEGVDAELISGNPVTVTISANEFETVSFVFRVAGEEVSTGAGALGIAFEVIDEAVDQCFDEFEPNNTPEEAASFSASEGLSAVLCSGDEDFYIFNPQLLPGAPFVVTVFFSAADADIDAALVTPDGQLVDFGGSVTDNEILTGIATGGDFILQVFPFAIGASPAPYSVTVEEGAPAGDNSCCEAAPTPGCNDPAVEECVCAQDSFCCEVEFDDACVQLAFGCGASCGGVEPESNCCETSDVPGCTVPEVNACLCQIDFDCCVSGFDEVCVAEAIASCGAQCELPPPESDCCAPSGVPGCGVPEISSCVCDIDPFCCAGAFDENCTAIAVSQCDMECSG